MYVTRQSQNGWYYWDEKKTLKADGFLLPVVPLDTLPSKFEVPNHMELGYDSGVHYDSVVSTVTNKVHESIPHKQPQALVDLTNLTVIDKNAVLTFHFVYLWCII